MWGITTCYDFAWSVSSWSICYEWLLTTTTTNFNSIFVKFNEISQFLSKPKLIICSSHLDLVLFLKWTEWYLLNILLNLSLYPQLSAAGGKQVEMTKQKFHHFLNRDRLVWSNLCQKISVVSTLLSGTSVAEHKVWRKRQLSSGYEKLISHTNLKLCKSDYKAT